MSCPAISSFVSGAPRVIGALARIPQVSQVPQRSLALDNSSDTREYHQVANHPRNHLNHPRHPPIILGKAAEDILIKRETAEVSPGRDDQYAHCFNLIVTNSHLEQEYFYNSVF